MSKASKSVWITSKTFRGVRYREHESRRHGPRPDRYFMIRFQVDGKRCEESLGWASEGWSEKRAFLEMEKLKEAAKLGEGPSSLKEKRALAEQARQIREAEEERKRVESITFGEFFRDTYFPQEQVDGKNPRSLRREEELFRLRLDPVIGSKPLRAVTPIDLERVKSNMLKAQLSARSIHYCLAVARQVFNQARRLGILETESPTTKVRFPSEDNRRVRFLTREEADRLLIALAEHSRDTYDIALLSLHCGLRVGEIFGLEWGDVDFERNMLTLRGTSRKAGTRTKSGKTRPVILTKQAKYMLMGRVRGDHHDLIFPGRKGKRREAISATFDRVVQELGFNDGVEDDRQKVVFHTLRHTFASWCRESGVDLFVVKELLGHSEIKMTERYSHIGENALRDAVRNLERCKLVEQPKGKVIKFKR